MTKDHDKLSALAEIAEVLSDRALQPVMKAGQSFRDAETKLATISAHRERLSVNANDPVISALMAGQSVRLRQLQTQASTELARARAELEIAKDMARKPFARWQVLEKLADAEKPSASRK